MRATHLIITEIRGQLLVNGLESLVLFFVPRTCRGRLLFFPEAADQGRHLVPVSQLINKDASLKPCPSLITAQSFKRQQREDSAIKVHFKGGREEINQVLGP